MLVDNSTPKIAILAIGNEILSGKVLNSNAHFLTREFKKNGFNIALQIACQDQKESIVSSLDFCFQKATIVITTGGLGPTCDDLTKEICSKYMGYSLAPHPDIAAAIARTFPKAKTLENQSILPSGGLFFENKIGTAWGIVLRKNAKTLIMLPGVPKELEELCQNSVLSFLQKEFPQKTLKKSKFLSFVHLKERQVDPLLREIQDLYPDVECGIYPNYGYLSTTLNSKNQESLEKAYFKLQNQFAEYVFSTDLNSLPYELMRLMTQKKLTLATAESCTGGHIASEITKVSGASQYFLGSVVCYANSIKENILSVSSKTLKQYGAVSKETVYEMAKGILKITGADFAIAVSGIAGPEGGSSEKPVGTVWAALMGKNGYMDIHLVPITIRENRELIITYSCNYLLGCLYKYVKTSSL